MLFPSPQKSPEEILSSFMVMMSSQIPYLTESVLFCGGLHQENLGLWTGSTIIL